MYQSKKKSRLGDVSAYFFLLPAIVLSVLFIVVPLILTFRYSFTDWSGLGEYNNIGFQNFQNLMSDSVFWESIKTTFIWVLLYVICLPITSLILALVLEFGMPFKSLKPVGRTIFFMPMMMSMAAVALLWQLIFNPNLGILPKLLTMLGVTTTSVDFLGDYNFKL